MDNSILLSVSVDSAQPEFIFLFLSNRQDICFSPTNFSLVGRLITIGDVTDIFAIRPLP